MPATVVKAPPVAEAEEVQAHWYTFHLLQPWSYCTCILMKNNFIKQKLKEKKYIIKLTFSDELFVGKDVP